ncbi:hypothetical protein ACKKBG_A22685 [Auxenochlorella protothecoides x Auxenochlorella symbiontica]
MVTTSSAVQAQPPPAAASGEPAVLDRMKGAVTTLLECIGEDPKREGLVDTPKRVAKAWLDMTRGSGQDHTGAFGSALFHEPCLAAASDGLVLVRDITFAALSSSALLPFYGAVHVAYLPRHGTILGLSKLARVTKVLAARLQDQAGFTRSLLAAVVAELAPAGAAVVCVARQLGGIEAESGPRVTCLAAGALRRADRLIELEAVLDLAPGALDLGAEGAAGLDTELLIGSGPDHVDVSRERRPPSALNPEPESLDDSAGRAPPATRARMEAAVRVLVEGVAEAHGAKVDARALVASRRYVAWLLRATAGYGAALPRGGTPAGPCSPDAGSSSPDAGPCSPDAGPCSPSASSSASDMELDAPADGARAAPRPRAVRSRSRSSDSSSDSALPVGATWSGAASPASMSGDEGEGACRPVAPGALMASLALQAPTRAAPHSALHLSCHAFSSECEHHLLPFHGTVGFAVLGAAPDAGALRAAVAAYSRRLQVQERLTVQLADEAWAAAAGAEALLVVVRSAHMCMVARGVEQHASTTTCSSSPAASGGSPVALGPCAECRASWSMCSAAECGTASV